MLRPSTSESRLALLLLPESLRILHRYRQLGDQRGVIFVFWEIEAVEAVPELATFPSQPGSPGVRQGVPSMRLR